MNIKYAVLNPLDGSYQYVETQEQALEIFWTNMIKLSYPHFHNTPYSIIETDDTGAEHWKTADSTIIENPLLAKERQASLMAEVISILND
jgi:hypothetical protein